jgi:hypothetical protein
MLSQSGIRVVRDLRSVHGTNLIQRLAHNLYREQPRREIICLDKINACSEWSQVRRIGDWQT